MVAMQSADHTAFMDGIEDEDTRRLIEQTTASQATNY